MKNGGEMKSYQLSIDNITKIFPGVKALSNVTMKAMPGEVLAIIGENGAGKSTLLKILNGDIRQDEGDILLDNEVVDISNPTVALKLGISMIYQERQLISELSVSENIFAGKLPIKGMLVDWNKLHKMTRKLLDEFDLQFSEKMKVKNLSVAHQQMVEIIKNYNRDTRIIAFDEPTASLSEKEIATLFQIINKLKSENAVILYISHRMKEIFDITDKIVVLKDGAVVGQVDTAKTDEKELIKMMVGRDINDSLDRNKIKADEVVLELRHLTNQKIKDISFELHKGEILGFSGLVGAGRTELARAMFGADPVISGEVFIRGQAVKIKHPKDAIQNGMMYCTEDRKLTGLIMSRSVKDNICVAVLKNLCRCSFVNKKKERELANEYVEKLNIKTPSISSAVRSLSGGNQQKVVLSRWLAANPKILILDEPTRGIDLGAKFEIYRLINKLAEQGMSIIFISSELPEIIAISDNVVVMRNGKISAMLSKDELNEEVILTHAMIKKRGTENGQDAKN